MRHTGSKMRFGLPVAPTVKYLAIRTRVRGNNRDPSIFSRPLLAIATIPGELLSGGIVRRLLKISAVQRTARLIIERYPGGDALLRMTGWGGGQ